MPPTPNFLTFVFQDRKRRTKDLGYNEFPDFYVGDSITFEGEDTTYYVKETVVAPRRRYVYLLDEPTEHAAGENHVVNDAFYETTGTPVAQVAPVAPKTDE